MSAERRDQLIDQVVETQPELRAFVQQYPSDMTAGSWNLVSYSFQRGFEAMWDLAQTDSSGLLLRPLLLLWRQSVELAIKAAITEIAGRFEPSLGHKLDKLFAQLRKERVALGYSDDDEYTSRVVGMVALVQDFDPYADRFRYPTMRDGRPFEGIEADLDELLQAHFLIVTWCEGAVAEISETRFADH
jgi:HEPN domain-containing protein